MKIALSDNIVVGQDIARRLARIAATGEITDDSGACVEANGGIDAFIELLAGFEYLYKINERSRLLEDFSRSDFLETHYVNLFASRGAVPAQVPYHRTR